MSAEHGPLRLSADMGPLSNFLMLGLQYMRYRNGVESTHIVP